MRIFKETADTVSSPAAHMSETAGQFQAFSEKLEKVTNANSVGVLKKPDPAEQPRCVGVGPHPITLSEAAKIVSASADYNSGKYS